MKKNLDSLENLFEIIELSSQSKNNKSYTRFSFIYTSRMDVFL